MAALDTFSIDVFERIVEKAEACGAELPGCRYVSHCAPALDCCDVMAFYPEIIQNDPGVANLTCIVDPRVTFALELWWKVCLPQNAFDGLSIPEAAQTTEEALTMQDAAYKVYSALIESVNESPCGSLDDARLECLDPQGGCAGWKITAATRLESV